MISFVNALPSVADSGTANWTSLRRCCANNEALLKIGPIRTLLTPNPLMGVRIMSTRDSGTLFGTAPGSAGY